MQGTEIRLEMIKDGIREQCLQAVTENNILFELTCEREKAIKR